MNDGMIQIIHKTMQSKSTEELVRILRENDRGKHSDAAFLAIRQVLEERGEQQPGDNVSSNSPAEQGDGQITQRRTFRSAFIRAGLISGSPFMAIDLLLLALAIRGNASLNTLGFILFLGLLFAVPFGVVFGLVIGRFAKGGKELLPFSNEDVFKRLLKLALNNMGYRLHTESEHESIYNHPVKHFLLADPIHIRLETDLAIIIGPLGYLEVLKAKLSALDFASKSGAFSRPVPTDFTKDITKRLCLLCSKRLSVFANHSGMCRNCFQEWQFEKARRAEEQRKRAERERRLREIPIEIQSAGLASFAENITGDSPIDMMTIALWPEEIGMAERIGESIGAALLTSGFVGRMKQQPFGIVALTKTCLWRIEVGYASSGFNFYNIETIKRKIMRLDLSDLKAQIEYSPKSCVLLLKSQSLSRTVAILVFPNKFEHPFTHPFFEYAATHNERLAFDIAKQIGSDA